MVEDARERKKYEAPKVTVISLRPEEAVLAACKTNTGGGPVGSGCQHGNCRGNGS
jgi:hypothetical protein